MEQTTPPRKAYPSDLRESEWAILEPLVPAVKPGGRPARHTRREIINAILYVVRGAISGERCRTTCRRGRWPPPPAPAAAAATGAGATTAPGRATTRRCAS